MKIEKNLELIFEKMDYRDEIIAQIKRAKKEFNAERVVYYEEALSKSAVVSYEAFKKSWAYQEWIKKPEIQAKIQRQEAQFKRFTYLR